MPDGAKDLSCNMSYDMLYNAYLCQYCLQFEVDAQQLEEALVSGPEGLPHPSTLTASKGQCVLQLGVQRLPELYCCVVLLHLGGTQGGFNLQELCLPGRKEGGAGGGGRGGREGEREGGGGGEGVKKEGEVEWQACLGGRG